MTHHIAFFATFLLGTFFSSGATLTDIIINEFLASNQNNITDEDGDTSDWIEIRNTSGVNGDLEGWYLTDDPSDLTKWTLPALPIDSGAIIGIFASGKDRPSLDQIAHTNFRLQSSEGGYLALVKPDGTTIASEFANLPEQRPDISYSSAGFHLDPTPGAENNASFEGFVEDTSFSVDRGFYDSPISLEITTETTGASIRYTTNGTPPSSTQGILYTGPINIDETTIIRALAFKANCQPTNVDTHTYLFPESVIEQPRMRTAITQSNIFAPQMVDSLMAVPSISIVADNPAPFQNENGANVRVETQTSVEMIYPDGTPGFQEDGGLSNFGGRFTNFPKKSFRIAFRSEFGATSLEHPLFDGFDYPNFQPAEEFEVINLRSGSHDMAARGAYMSNRFTDDSMLEMGNVAPHGRFVHVYLNGEYWGQYHLRERWNADMAASYFGGDKDDYEAVNANNTRQEFYNGPFDGSNVDGDVYDGSGVEWEQVRSLITANDPFANARNDLDIANVIDFMLLWLYGNSESEFRAFGSPVNGLPFQFFIKDADGFLRTPNATSHAVTHNGPLNALTLLRNDNDPDYDILLADRIHQHYFNDGALTPEKNIARLEARLDEARLGFISEAARWGDHFRDPDSWEAFQTNLINNHFPTITPERIARFRSAGMLPDVNAPLLSQHGGSIPSGAGITMTTNANRIYYTEDGSDPRLPGGAISPSAILATFNETPREPETFVPAGSVWSYLDDGSDQGSAWQQPSFDDSNWESGPAQLGYGENSVSTTVGFIDTDPNTAGTQQNATTYYRHTVNIDSPSDFSSFLLQLRYDDGAAAYINGVEVARTANLAPNAAFNEFASTPTPSENTFFEFPVSSSLFVDGLNTIAVEIHNISARSSDTRFDLILSGQTNLNQGDNVSEAIIFTSPTQLMARSFDSNNNEWSALTSTFFSLDTIPADDSNLVISEIHYHPAPPTTEDELAASTDQDDFEFIELQNIGSQPIDFSGISLEGGIDFHFADNTIIDAGGYILIVSDLEAFSARYGESLSALVADEYDGNLRNSGEQLILRAPGNTIISDITYDDRAPWPLLTDGEGFSMIFTGSDQSIGSDWSTNANFNGSPGEENSAQILNYDDWRTANGVTDDDSDDDQDGLSAFAEYAIGSDPNLANNTTPFLGSVLTEGNQNFLAISYPQSLLATDVTFIVQESTDLETWVDVSSSILISEIPNDNGLTQQVTQRLDTPITSDSSRFLRVRMFR